MAYYSVINLYIKYIVNYSLATVKLIEMLCIYESKDCLSGCADRLQEFKELKYILETPTL